MWRCVVSDSEALAAAVAWASARLHAMRLLHRWIDPLPWSVPIPLSPEERRALDLLQTLQRPGRPS